MRMIGAHSAVCLRASTVSIRVLATQGEQATQGDTTHRAGIETKQQIKQYGTGTGTDHIQEQFFVFTKFLGRQSK
jgi:hypothetical protein